MKTLTCKGSPDFELNAEFDREIKFHIVEPKGISKGVVFFIACFGLGMNYIEKWLEKASKKYSMTAVAVEYHCFYSRPELGANINFPPDAFLKLNKLSEQYTPKFQLNMEFIQELGQTLKSQHYIEGIELVPLNGEYQNFGTMQALDHLYVIEHLIRLELKTDFNNIILFGSSHGGYIAHLIAKFAPNTIRLIIDNSSYIAPPPNYLGFGSEYSIKFGNLILGCSIKTKWQHSNPYLPTYYNLHNRLIRDTTHGLNVRCGISKRELQVIAFQASENDTISWPANKIHQQQNYNSFVGNYELVMIDKTMIGSVFKSLEHGLNASLWGLFEHAMDVHEIDLPIFKCANDFKRKTKFKYECLTADYEIYYGKDLPVELNINKHRTI